MPYAGAAAPAWFTTNQTQAGLINGVWNRTYLQWWADTYNNGSYAGLDDNGFPNRWHWVSSLWVATPDAPSAGHQSGWLMYSVGSLIGFLGALTIFLAILFDKRLRKQPFKIYILFLVLTDTLFSFLCLQCFWNWAAGSWVGGDLFCDAQSWYVTFGFGGSMYMNALIALKIRNMLVMGLAGRSYSPPPIPQVILESCGLYCWTAFIASWIFIDAIPVRAVPIAGIACFAADTNFTSLMFFWLVYVVVFAGLPVVVIAGIIVELLYCKKILKRMKLGNNTKDAKAALALAKFFGKLLVVFVVMWIPAIAGVWVFGGEGATPWLTAVGGMWSHFQGAVSAYFYTEDAEILQAVKNLLKCKLNYRPDDFSSSSSSSSSGRA